MGPAGFRTEANLCHLYFAQTAYFQGFNDGAAAFRSTPEGATDHSGKLQKTLELIADA